MNVLMCVGERRTTCVGVYVESSMHIHKCLHAHYISFRPYILICVCNGLGPNVISRFRIKVTSPFSLFRLFYLMQQTNLLFRRRLFPTHSLTY